MVIAEVHIKILNPSSRKTPIILFIIFSISFKSVTCKRFFSSTILFGELPVVNISSKTSFAILPDILSDIISLTNSPKELGEIGELEILISFFYHIKKKFYTFI